MIDIGGSMGETMTVAELIEALSKMPPGAAVITEGCDCLGEVRSLDLDCGEDVPTVVLCRS